jgi:hypothetical protein
MQGSHLRYHDSYGDIPVALFDQLIPEGVCLQIAQVSQKLDEVLGLAVVDHPYSSEECRLLFTCVNKEHAMTDASCSVTPAKHLLSLTLLAHFAANNDLSLLCKGCVNSPVL